MVAWFLAAILLTQTPDGEPSFESASIKAVAMPDDHRIEGARGGPGTDRPDLFTCGYCNLPDLVSTAYGVARVRNRAAFQESNYQIRAEIPDGASVEQFHLMLQKLLVERLHLKVHPESKKVAAYRLVIAKGGFKLPESSPATDAGWGDAPGPEIIRQSAGFHLAAKRTTAGLSLMLEKWVDGPVTDATGLTGKYDFDVGSTAPFTNKSLSEVLEAQVGLKLELDREKGSVKVLVIDHADTRAK